MINNISWSSYWSALTFLVLLYYTYVLWVYFRGDIIRRPAGNKMAVAPAGSLINPATDHGVDDNIFPVVQSFTNEVSAYLEQAAYGKPVKNEIIYGLQQIAKKHPGIHQSTYLTAVNQLIQFESKDKCAVALSEREISQVWLV